MEWFETIGGEVVQLDETDARTQRWFAEAGVSWALQRPDFYLFGTATDAGTASTLLADLKSHLSAEMNLEGAAR